MSDIDKVIESRGYTCPHCKDSNLEFPDCETCGGNGWVYDPSNGGTMTCPECQCEPCHLCGDGRDAGEWCLAEVEKG